MKSIAWMIAWMSASALPAMSERAEACTCRIPSAEPLALPAPDTTAPPSTLVWIARLDGLDPSTLELLVDGRARPFDLETSRHGDLSAGVVRPRQPLPEGATVRVTARGPEQTPVELTSFRIDARPATARVGVGARMTVVERSTSCGETGVSATLPLTPTRGSPVPVLVFAASVADVIAAPSRRPDAIVWSSAPQVTTFRGCGPANIHGVGKSVTVVVADLAGNRSTPTEVIAN